MNRLSSNVMLEDMNAMISEVDITEEHLEENQVQTTFLDGLTTPEEQTELCSVFTPLHYERNYAYPLLVWLHGEGKNEKHLRQVMPKISMRNYAAVAPRATLALGQERLPQLSNSFTWSLSDAHTSEAMDRVCMAVERAEQRFQIDHDRIFLAGSGVGGTMALQIGMTLPERFAGIISVGGALPRDAAPLAHLNASRRLPLLLTVDRENNEYSDALVCEDLRLLHIAGMTVTLRQYPAGDPLSDSMLSDIDQWIMEISASEQQASIISG